MANAIDFSEDNISYMERMIGKDLYRADPNTYEKDSEITYLLMHLVAEALQYCGILPGKSSTYIGCQKARVNFERLTREKEKLDSLANKLNFNIL